MLLGWSADRDEPEVFDPYTEEAYPPLPPFLGLSSSNWGVTGRYLWAVDASAQLKLIAWDASEGAWTCEVVASVPAPVRTGGPPYRVVAEGSWAFLVEPIPHRFRVFRRGSGGGWEEVEHEIPVAMSIRTDGEVLVVGANYYEDSQGGYGHLLQPTLYRLPDLEQGHVITERWVTSGTMSLGSQGMLTMLENDSSMGLLFDLADVPGAVPVEVPPLAPPQGYDNWHNWYLAVVGGRLVAGAHLDPDLSASGHYGEEDHHQFWFDPADAAQPPWLDEEATVDQELKIYPPNHVFPEVRDPRPDHVVPCP